jgi:uncharacterized protein (DUF2147 family)
MVNKLMGIAMPVIMAASVNAGAQQYQQEILGEWWSPQKDSQIQIYTRQNKYYGKIVWGTGSDAKDIHNPDAQLKNRDVVGLEILTGFTCNGDNNWAGGTIYDPREGKTYSCKMSLDGKNRLRIRGYIGLSLLGRTEVWTKNQ